MAYVKSFLRKKNVLCVLSLSFCGVKKQSLLSVEIIQFLIFSLLLLLLICFLFSLKFSNKKVFSSYCLERSQSQCISVDPVSVMYVCLTTLRKSVTGWDLKSTKNAGFPISTTDCTYAFCTSGIFYTGD